MDGCQCCCQFSFPLFNARWKCIKNGATGWWLSSQWCNCTFILIRIGVRSSPKSGASPCKNLVHHSSKIWCVPLSKIPSYPLPKSGHLSLQKSGASLFKNLIIFLFQKSPAPSELLLSPQESAKNPSFHTCSHLATVGILQYVDCPDLSYACWPLTILAWWYLPSFFLQDSFQVSLFGRDLLSLMAPISCKS